MKDIDVLKHTSVDHLPLTGGTLTGDLTIKKNDGSASKLMVHRTLNGQDMQGSFDVYATNAIGGHGACALSTNNKTTNQQEACYVFAKDALWSPNRYDNSRPDLGAAGYPFKDVYTKGAVINNVNGLTEGYFAFSNGQRFVSAVYGKANGEIGMYNNLNSRHIFMYNIVNAKPTITFDANLKPNANNNLDLGEPNFRWRTLYSVNAINTSDKNYKENIEYISNNKAKGVKEASVRDDKVTYQDMYDFYKDIELAKYNYIDQEHQEFGFIAQDIADTKVGSEIVIDSEEGYMYSVGSYVSTIAGALKHSINKIDALEKENEELKDRLKKIEEKLGI